MKCMRNSCSNKEYIPAEKFVKLVSNGEFVRKDTSPDSQYWYLCKKCLADFTIKYMGVCREKPDKENSTNKNSVKLPLNNKEKLITYDASKILLNYLLPAPKKTKNEKSLF